MSSVLCVVLRMDFIVIVVVAIFLSQFSHQNHFQDELACDFMNGELTENIIMRLIRVAGSKQTKIHNFHSYDIEILYTEKGNIENRLAILHTQ